MNTELAALVHHIHLFDLVQYTHGFHVEVLLFQKMRKQSSTGLSTLYLRIAGMTSIGQDPEFECDMDPLPSQISISIHYQVYQKTVFDLLSLFQLSIHAQLNNDRLHLLLC